MEDTEQDLIKRRGESLFSGMEIMLMCLLALCLCEQCNEVVFLERSYYGDLILLDLV